MKLILFLVVTLLWKSFPQTMLIFDYEKIPYTDTCLVFLPDDYSPNSEYPVLFLLHGWSGNYKQWNEIIDLADVSNEYGFIIVCPDGFYDSWYINSPVKENFQYEDFFFNILFKEIKNRYNTDTLNIFVSGLSMGGFGAFNLFFKKPELFKSAGSSSGVLDITAFPGNWGMEKIFGDFAATSEFYSKFTPINRLESIKTIGKEIIFDCGTEDRIYEVNKMFFEKCRELKIPVTFISQPGKHNKDYWRKAIKQQIRFFSELLN